MQIIHLIISIHYPNWCTLKTQFCQPSVSMRTKRNYTLKLLWVHEFRISMTVFTWTIIVLRSVQMPSTVSCFFSSIFSSSQLLKMIRMYIYFMERKNSSQNDHMKETSEGRQIPFCIDVEKCQKHSHNDIWWIMCENNVNYGGNIRIVWDSLNNNKKKLAPLMKLFISIRCGLLCLCPSKYILAYRARKKLWTMN